MKEEEEEEEEEERRPCSGYKGMGSGGVAPHILNLNIVWRSVISFMIRQLYHEKELTFRH
jgi:hypothetical protein